MFAPLQPPYYRVMGANSLKQMETRGHICMPEGMRNAESMSSNNFVFLQQHRLWKTNSGMVYSAGKRKKLQSGCTKRSTSTSGLHLQSVPRWFRRTQHDGVPLHRLVTRFQGWTVAPHGSGHSTQPCKTQALSWGQACREAANHVCSRQQDVQGIGNRPVNKLFKTTTASLEVLGEEYVSLPNQHLMGSPYHRDAKSLSHCNR